MQTKHNKAQGKTINVSIIVPFYYGNKYLNNLLEGVKKTCDIFSGNVELILVNDSPEVTMEYNRNIINGFSLVEIKNEKNVGIHGSRANGLKNANGEYILFLDQDDNISEESVSHMYEVAQETGCDIVVANGLIEDEKREQYSIFGNHFSQRFALRELPYLMARNFIISPGQCLIKATTIPEVWTRRIMKKNGADDLLLWILMFDAGRRFNALYERAYQHSFTGLNYSSDISKMRESQQEVIDTLTSIKSYSGRKIRRLRNSMSFKSTYKQHPVRSALRHPIVLLYNIYYRLVWRGYIAKNQN